MTRFWPSGAAVCLLALVAGTPLSVQAQQQQTPQPEAPVPAPQHAALALEAGAGRVMTLAVPATNIFVADPKVVEVRPASASSLFVFGVAAGHTTVAAMDNAGHLLVEYDVMVQPSAYGAREAQAAIARLVPGSRVQVQAQTKGLLLTGAVASPADAAQAVSIAKGYNPDSSNIDNELTIDAPVQVNLNVRIAQMSRQVVRNLGINWSTVANIGQIGHILGLQLTASTTTGSLTVQGCPSCLGAGFLGVIDALANDNLAHVLAEPNLTVLSGQSASFQVGGEYPIPVAGGTNGQVQVSYKDYGVMLTFLPTVLSDGRINLHVKPEVSELSVQNAATVSSGSTTLVVPALTVRRAETTVELGSGESFAIAGLLQQETSDASSGLPGAGDIPVLGTLFHDNQFTRTDTELVVVVTAYVVRPVTTLAALHLPTDGYNPPPDLERLLLMRQVADSKPPIPVRLPGDAGFIVQ